MSQNLGLRYISAVKSPPFIEVWATSCIFGPISPVTGRCSWKNHAPNWDGYTTISDCLFLLCCKNWWRVLSITTITALQILRCKDCGLPESWMSCNQLDVWRSASYGLKPHPKSALARIKVWGPITSMYIHPIFCYFMMGTKYYFHLSRWHPIQVKAIIWPKC